MADDPALSEYTGRSVEEAIHRALSQLQLTRDQVEITVLSEGRPGILGVGAQPARVRVTPKPRPERPAPVFADEEALPVQPFFDDEDEEAVALDPDAVFAGTAPAADEDEEEEPARPARSAAAPSAGADLATESAVDVLETLLQLMGFEATVTPRPPATPGEGVGLITAVLDVKGAPGQEMGLLIGRKGETLAALQYMLNLIVNHQTRAHATFGIDIEGYRQRREAQLQELARRVADRVRRNRQPMTLEPMPPAERRIVHLALANDPDVQTVSIGEGEARKVAITPKK
jgi:spoIIIJ-associated protein